MLALANSRGGNRAGDIAGDCHTPFGSLSGIYSISGVCLRSLRFKSHPMQWGNVGFGPSAERRILRGWDLNPRPPGYEPDELPDCSTPRQIGQGEIVNVTPLISQGCGILGRNQEKTVFGGFIGIFVGSEIVIYYCGG